MRRNDREIYDRSEMECILLGAKVCRLGCCDEMARPYVIPLSFGYREGNIYIHSANEGQKIDILRQNPYCCIEVDECTGIVGGENPCSAGMRYRSVICRGRAFFITDPEEKMAGLNSIINHYGYKSRSFSEQEIRDVCVIRIGIDGMTGKKAGQ